MANPRKVARVWHSQPTMEGAGVRLRRAFGFDEVPQLDPFLLLDDFRASAPEDYRRGFPWHPHRGMETITYMLAGDVEHGDSLGNRGVTSAGGVQWMTAGSGIIHQEMPKGDAEGRMGGFQLWSNLPARDKMMDPRYREVRSDEIPVAKLAGGGLVRVICGEVEGVRGPVREIVTEPEYLDVSLPAGRTFTHATAPGHNVFAYVIEGQGRFDSAGAVHGNHTLVHYGHGDQVAALAVDEPVRFLLVSGRPLKEPIAWNGPIVMNTQAELRQAFRDYERGAFVKQGRRAP